jgi:hypothetical protein
MSLKKKRIAKPRHIHALMHGNTELLQGDQASISIIFRNLTGLNPTSPGYIEMMNEKLGVTIDPKRLSIKTR